MTMNDGARDARQNCEPTEIEALLPWYAVGTLRRRDRQRVETRCATIPILRARPARARGACRDHSCLNELLGAPSARAMDRLMAAIDAETVAARKPSLAAGRCRPVRQFDRQLFAAHARRRGRQWQCSRSRCQAFMLVEHARRSRRATRPHRSQGDDAWARHIRDGAFCPRGERRRDHEISAKTTRPRWSMARSPAAFIACGSR